MRPTRLENGRTAGGRVLQVFRRAAVAPPCALGGGAPQVAAAAAVVAEPRRRLRRTGSRAPERSEEEPLILQRTPLSDSSSSSSTRRSSTDDDAERSALEAAWLRSTLAPRRRPGRARAARSVHGSASHGSSGVELSARQEAALHAVLELWKVYTEHASPGSGCAPCPPHSSSSRATARAPLAGFFKMPLCTRCR